MPAKSVWATRSFRQPALSLTSIASKLAPTILSRVNPIPCRSRLAGEKRLDNAFIQTARVIVDVHRWQASSYHFESCEPNHRVGAGLLRAAFRR